MEDFTCLALEKVLTGFFPLEAYQDAGFSRAQIDEVRNYRRDAAARNDYAVTASSSGATCTPRW
jgi:hypothetical protein